MTLPRWTPYLRTYGAQRGSRNFEKKWDRKNLVLFKTNREIYFVSEHLLLNLRKRVYTRVDILFKTKPHKNTKYNTSYDIISLPVSNAVILGAELVYVRK